MLGALCSTCTVLSLLVEELSPYREAVPLLTEPCWSWTSMWSPVISVPWNWQVMETAHTVELYKPVRSS